MQAKLQPLFNRLELLTLRERLLLLVGLPLLLVVVCELLVFEPARKAAAAAAKETELKGKELAALQATLAAQPAVPTLPEPDQLMRQRNELLAQIEAAQGVVARVSRPVDWGTVVRASVSGAAGLELTLLRALPAELVIDAAKVQTPAQAASAAKAAALSKTSAQPAPRGSPLQQVKAAAASASAGVTPSAVAGVVVANAVGGAIYRHRAELSVTGPFPAVLSYLQVLQRVAGDLRWDKMQLNVAAYPRATLQLNLHTLSDREETPFN